MSEWSVILLLITLGGALLAAARPLVSLTKSITAMDENIKALGRTLSRLEESLGSMREANRRSHQKLWEKNEQQDRVLQNHEIRIRDLESETS